MIRPIEKTGGVEVGADPQFQGRWASFQKLMLVSLTVFVLCAAAGLFGRGPLSKATIGNPGDPLQVEYDRFARYRTSGALLLSLGPKAVPAGGVPVQILVSRDLADTLQISQSAPPPAAAQAVQDGLLLVYHALPSEKAIRIPQEPTQSGLLNARVAIPGVSELRFQQIVYP